MKEKKRSFNLALIGKKEIKKSCYNQTIILKSYIKKRRNINYIKYLVYYNFIFKV